MFEHKVSHLRCCKKSCQIIKIGPYNHKVAPVATFLAPCIWATLCPNTGFRLGSACAVLKFSHMLHMLF